MDHAAAHEALADLALEPHRLRRIDLDTTPETEALRAHLRECPDCLGELEAWRRVYRAIDVAVAVQPGNGLHSVEDPAAPRPSPELRERTLAAIHRQAGREGRAGREGEAQDGERGDRTVVEGPLTRRLGRPALPSLGRIGWLAAAAALIVAIGAGGLAVSRSQDADHARVETAELAAATATLGRILAEPTHWVVTLRTADGAAGGTLAWSGSEMVVLTSALPAPMAGTAYRCWIERAGTRTPVGTMSFAGSTGYWSGSTPGWKDMLASGSRFGVTEVPASGTGGGSAVLVADL